VGKKKKEKRKNTKGEMGKDKRVGWRTGSPRGTHRDETNEKKTTLINKRKNEKKREFFD